MPDPDTALIAEANRHRLRGDEFRKLADDCARSDPEEAERLRNRASVAYALAETIIVNMKKD